MRERTHLPSEVMRERTHLPSVVMVFLSSQITLFGVIASVSSQNIFLKHADFEATFCEDKMIARGITRSLIECASLCSLNILCTGFFYDDGKYCFLTEEHMSDKTTCSFRKGHYYTNLGMFILYSK